MAFSWFLTLFERIFNFFAVLIGNLEKPFNEIFYSFTIYNPFGNYEYVFRFESSVEFINDFINTFNEVVLSFVTDIAGGIGVKVTDPTWVVILAMIPTIFVITIVIKMIIGIFS